MRKVPKLRFKEFTDEWEEKKLGEILEFKNGVNASKEQYGKGIKFINVLDILNNDFITYNNIIGKVDIDKNMLEKYAVTYGDILFQRSSETREEVGIANVYLDKENRATFGGFVIRGKKIGDYIPIFLNKLLKTNLARNEITSKSGGSTRYNVGQEILKDVKLFFPSLQEQEKIANFLSSVDKKISLTEEKLELFKEYKKGVMQKIFSQELRFKDNEGNDYPEWEEKRLGDVLESIVDNRGKTPPNNDNNKLIPLIEVNAIGERNIKYGNVTKFVDEETYINWFRNYIQKDDILFSTVGATALCSIYKANIKSVIAQNLVGLRAKKEIISDYLYYVLIDKKNNLKFKSIEMIAVQPSIKVSQMVDLKFKISISLEEQQKIADFLSSIDTKIENIEKELENLKEFKKGLLQQMFV